VANGLVYVGSRGGAAGAPEAVFVVRLDNGAQLAALQLSDHPDNYNISPIVVSGTVLASLTTSGVNAPWGVPTLQAFHLP
jgi:hypothetical protein